MKLCKALDCKTEIQLNRTYCSQSCRTRTTNLLYKDYKKSGDTLHRRGVDGYVPKRCKNCDSEISYDRRKNQFCSKSCSASFNNIARGSIERKFSETGLQNIRNSNADRWNNPELRIAVELSLCQYCKSKRVKQRNRKFCSKECRINGRAIQFHSDISLKDYRVMCRFDFALNQYPDKFDFDLIREHGWYKAKNHGDNLYGVSRDHMFSVVDGYKLKVPPDTMKHPANCQLLLHSANSRKGKKSSITYEELLERIANWT